MTLTAAASSKTTSDGTRSAPDVDNLTITAINAGIGNAASSGLYIYIVNLEGKITNSLVQVKQSDGSYIDLEIIVYALKENGYRVSYNEKNTSSGFKVNLTAAWN